MLFVGGLFLQPLSFFQKNPLAVFLPPRGGLDRIPCVSALACFALIRRWRANCLQFAFHHPGEGLDRIFYVSALADFALIRRWRATFPTRGKATAAVPHC